MDDSHHLHIRMLARAGKIATNWVVHDVDRKLSSGYTLNAVKVAILQECTFHG